MNPVYTELSKPELQALVTFWGKYMRARKAFERKQKEARDEDRPFDTGLWLAYKETKQDAFNELVITLPEVRYTDFWRDVSRLQPQGCVDGVLRYRREKAAEKEREREEALKTKAVTKGKKK